MPGLNLAGIPVDPVIVPDLAALLKYLGTSDTLSGVTRFDSRRGLFENCGYDGDEQPTGAGCNALVLPGDGWVIEALKATTIDYDLEISCPVIELRAGLNLIALPCAAAGLDAYEFLQALQSSGRLATIQTLEQATGRWLSATVHADMPIGQTFVHETGHAYLISMHRPLTLDPPKADAGNDRYVLLPPGEEVRLDGSASDDPDSTSLLYQWQLEKPLGSDAVLLASDTPLPILSPDLHGTYRAALTVSDGISQSRNEVSVHVFDPAAGPDSDGDGLGALAEELLGTDPEVADSDGDGIEDGPEVISYGTNPTDADSDNDTFSDGDEIAAGADALDQINTPAGDLPSDPADIASDVDRTVATTVYAATQFLYTGASPIQPGVALESIEPKRAALLRGRVLDRLNQPLAGVSVTLLDRPEYGQTLTRLDGGFDLAVNGGGTLILSYDREGYLPAQRRVDVPWNGYTHLPDIILIPLDPQVTRVDLTAPVPMQIARGSRMTDDDGSRQATLMIPEGTTAEILLPGGGKQAIERLNIRATEYTVGPNGRLAMPAELPPTSGYTYAVELSADEAGEKLNGQDVLFSQPVPFYVENFLGFPVGQKVPIGYYDNDRGVWVPHPDGRVIQLLGITDGAADLDLDGSGPPADTIALADLGITDAEREQLAQLYAPGQSLWRVALTHLSTWDCNWPYGPPADAVFPNQPPPVTDISLEDPCPSDGSVIQCETQTLGEAVAVTGTPFNLHYSSNRVPGRQSAYTLSIPLSGDAPPSSVKQIKSRVDIDGSSFPQDFSPDPNQVYKFTWDGRDAYGRVLQGRQAVKVRVGYVYDGVYQQPRSVGPAFGVTSGVPILTGIPTRREVVLWQEHEVRIGPWDARTAGLGGWDLDIHHVYDPFGKFLYRGDGSRRSADAFVGRTIDTTKRLHRLTDVVAAPDGTLFASVYSATGSFNGIYRFDPDGTETLVGNTHCSDYKEGFALGDIGDGGPASEALMCGIRALALAPDGSLYFSEHRSVPDSGTHRVRKIGPDGVITTVAGTGIGGYSGDGGPATEARLGGPWSIAIGPDGALYIADYSTDHIRRVGPGGTITTVAGTGVEGFSGDGGPAIQAQLYGPRDIEVTPDGALYVADTYNRRIRRIGPDGIIDTVAGTGVRGFGGDGGPATQAQLNDPIGVAFANGNLYIADATNNRIRVVGPEGAITTIAGNGLTGYLGDGGYAAQASLVASRISAAADGKLYTIHSFDPARISEIVKPLPGFTATSALIASEDGSEIYSFDGYGRHLSTLDALTGSVLYSFLYDDGRLASVEDGDGNTTTIERDNESNPTAIVGPYGQRTTLSINANGYLSRITNPANESFTADYSGDGLLVRFADPNGNATRMTYDAQGLLTSSMGAAGRVQEFSRTEQGRDYDVSRTTSLGATTVYRVEDLSTGDRRRTVVSPDGTQNEVLIRTNGSRTATFSDGTVTDALEGPDPRFGLEAPLLTDLTVTTPSGRSRTTTLERDAILATPDDPLSLTQLTDTLTVNGRTATSVYDAATRTSTLTTAAGRQLTVTTDALGRPTYTGTAGIEPAVFAYDARGRLETVTQGSGADARAVNLAYNAEGYLTSITDALGRSAGFAYDDAGRVTQQTFPDGRKVFFDYDAKGNLTSLTPPGRPAHGFTYTAADLTAEYIPPDVGAGTNSTRYTYNLDKQLTRVLRPDGEVVDLAYDPAGRLATLTVPEGDFTYEYDTVTGDLSRINAPGGGTLAFGYDGSLLTDAAWAGEIVGSVGFDYDDDFHITSVAVNGADPIAYSYDADGLLVQVGDLTLTRNAQNGLLEGATLGTVSDTWIYNDFGEPVSYRAEQDGTSLIEIAYLRDKLGRITDKTETIGGVTTSYGYGYDLAGRLVELRKDGVGETTWGYDANGNRTHVNGVEIARYDDQDRLLEYAGATYTYSANGELETKAESSGVTRFDYDVLGNLHRVVLPEGTKIEYISDGRNRRIGKKVNGTIVQGFLYQDKLKPIAELDSNGNVVNRFIYATRINIPDYMSRNGIVYRLITDHVGSVRLVVEAATGNIVQWLNYDVFGNVLVDTNPGFQPFGFAGALYGPHTRLARFGSRDYDASTGRWTAKDRIFVQGDEANWFGYASNDPVNRLDPYGTVSINAAVLVVLKEIITNWAADTAIDFLDEAIKDNSVSISEMHEQLEDIEAQINEWMGVCDVTDEQWHEGHDVLVGMKWMTKGAIDTGEKLNKQYAQYILIIKIASTLSSLKSVKSLLRLLR